MRTPSCCERNDEGKAYQFTKMWQGRGRGGTQPSGQRQRRGVPGPRGLAGAGGGRRPKGGGGRRQRQRGPDQLVLRGCVRVGLQVRIQVCIQVGLQELEFQQLIRGSLQGRRRRTAGRRRGPRAASAGDGRARGAAAAAGGGRGRGGTAGVRGWRARGSAAARGGRASPRGSVAPGAVEGPAELSEQGAAAAAEPLVARYRVVSAGTLPELPVSSGPSRKSATLAQLSMFSEVEVVEVAEQTDGGRRRARIRSPAGWITLDNVNTGTVFAERIDDEVRASQEAEREAPHSEPREGARPAAGDAERREAPAVASVEGTAASAPPGGEAGSATDVAAAEEECSRGPNGPLPADAADAPKAQSPAEAAEGAAVSAPLSGARSGGEADEGLSSPSRPLVAGAAGAPEPPPRSPAAEAVKGLNPKGLAARNLLNGIRSGQVSEIIDAAEAEEAHSAEAGDAGRAPRTSSEEEEENIVPEGLLQAPAEIAASEVEAASSGAASAMNRKTNER
ncbi:unnamed protein product [Prorocentrum cordatum]|uniref:Uncharacterized protein n=1 Tax=Prorocentrum cordatum TaxID=2364126 RepID=A0ABN9T909_9DINO|nr:unnamed protein product [Polarella glacialis]